jgi:hypothetical protein
MDDGSLLALAFGDGLWKSDDLAFSWRKILNSPEAIFSLTDFGNGVYLAGTTGQTGNFWSNRQAIYRSVDFGENWKLVTKVKTDSDLTYVRSIIKINDQLAYAFIAGNEYAQHDRALKTYISTNQGASWSVTPNFLKSTFGELNAIYDASSPSPDIFIFGGQPDSNLFWVKF